MDRREMLGMAGAAGLVALGTHAWAQDNPHHAHMDKVHMDCLKACTDCATACNKASHHCLGILSEGKGETKLHARMHALAMDCAAFCALSSAMIARGSELMASSCEACAEACKTCAEVCEKSEAPMMKECAKECRECEKTCRAMVASMKGTRTTGVSR